MPDIKHRDTCNAAPVKRGTTEERRLAIAAAARAIVVERGLEGLRMREVAQRVGINIATLHYHVPSKEAIIELIASLMKADFQRLGSKGCRDGLTPKQMLRLELDTSYEIAFNHPDLRYIMSEFTERARRDPAVARILQEMQGGWMSGVAKILDAGVKDGSFRANLDPEIASKFVAATLLGATRIGSLTEIEYRALLDELERSLFKFP